MSPQGWEGPAAWAPLPAGEVHVWLAVLDELRPTSLLPRLSPDERARAERFRFEHDRSRFIAARGLLRCLLARHLGEDPGALRFAYGPAGKPRLETGTGPGPDTLRFNVSHSGGLALFAFSRGAEVGVDLEQERAIPEALAIAERYFSPRERADLGRLGEEERPRAFFRCWTRKESFIKATGEGLSRPLAAFDVTLAPGEPGRLLREGEGDAERLFWLEGLEPAAGFAAALAVEGRPVRLACWKWDGSLEVSDGGRRQGRTDDPQGGGESRGAVLDLASS